MNLQRPLKVCLFNDIIEVNSQYPSIFRINSKVSDLLSTSVGIPCEIVRANAGGLLYPNGTWIGCVGMLQTGDVDVAIAQYPQSEAMNEIMDFSYPFVVDRLTFATRKKEIASDVSISLSPFNFQVWVAMALCSVAVCLSLYWFGRKRSAFRDILQYVVSSILNNTVQFKYDRGNKKLHLIMLTWLLGAMLIIACYQSLLLSSLAVSQGNKIKDISQLSKEVENGRYDAKGRFNNRGLKEIAESPDASARLVGQRAYSNPNGYTMTLPFLEESKKSKVAFIEYTQNLNCLKSELFISEDYFRFQLFSFGVRKKFCCKEKVDSFIHRMAETGLYEKLVGFHNYQMEYIMLTYLHESSEDFVRPLTLVHLSGAFLILVVGLALAYCALVTEILVYRVIKDKKFSSRRK